jgi:hypothetical protein
VRTYLSVIYVFRTLLTTVNDISTSTVALDSLETQYVQSFYDTTYRAHMIRCLIQALKVFDNVSTGHVSSSDDGQADSSALIARNLTEMMFVDNCIHIFSELVLTSSKFMKQVCALILISLFGELANTYIFIIVSSMRLEELR